MLRQFFYKRCRTLCLLRRSEVKSCFHFTRYPRKIKKSHRFGAMAIVYPVADSGAVHWLGVGTLDRPRLCGIEEALQVSTPRASRQQPVQAVELFLDACIEVVDPAYLPRSDALYFL